MPPSLQGWLAEGGAAEADWGGYVTRLALRGELGSGGKALLLDLPALAQPYACRSATCAPGLRAPKMKSCCADLEVDLSPAEEAAIQGALPEISAWMQRRDPRWERGVPAVAEEGHLTRPGKRCVFAASSPTGLTCALHAVEDSTGRPRGTLKPMPCRLFPLLVIDLGDGRVLLSAVAKGTTRHVGLPPARAFPCVGADAEPLVENVRDTIVELWSEAVATRVVRAVRGWSGG